MPEEPESLSFPDAVMLNDGSFTSPQGNVVQTNYVDLSGMLQSDRPLRAGAASAQECRGMADGRLGLGLWVPPPDLIVRVERWVDGVPWTVIWQPRAGQRHQPGRVGRRQGR